MDRPNEYITENGDKVVWGQTDEKPYIQYDGPEVRVRSLGEGKKFGVVELTPDGYRPADLVLVEVPAKLKRARYVIAGMALGSVLTGAVTMGAGAVLGGQTSANMAAKGSSEKTDPSTEGEKDPIPTVTPSASTMTTHRALPTTPEACVAALPLDVKVGQMTVWGVSEGADLSKLANDFNEHHIGGAIIMKEPANAKATLAEFAAKQDIKISFSTDQEGGLVQRFTSIGTLPSQQEMASKPAAEAQKILNDHYAKLKDTGINVIFAPVADVDGGVKNNPIGKGRMYGDDPEKVAMLSNFSLKAAQANQLTGTLKHFPGLGKADGNPDFEDNVTTPPFEVIKKDFAPYLKAENKDKVGVMLSSAITPGLTEDGREKMAMFSKKTVNLLRDELGFKNSVLYTDALNSKQIMSTDMGISDAFVEATIAGVDAKIIVGTVGQTIDGKPVTLKDQMVTNVRRVDAAIKEKRLPDTQVDAQVLRIFGQKGLNACAVLASVV